MKKLFFVFLIVPFLLSSCTNKQEELVKAYEQDLDGVKIDLSLKVKKLKKIQTITAQDSINLELTGEVKDWTIDNINSEIDRVTKEREDFTLKAQLYKDSVEIEKNKSNSQFYRMKYYSEMSDWYRNQSVNESYDQYLEACYKLQRYFENPDKVLGNLWECTYTIKNPLLNATQEITKKYLFNADDTEILMDVYDE